MSDFTSIHGMCYDNGQTGNCDCDCELFLSNKCDAFSDVIEGMTEKEVEQLTLEYMDEFKLGVLRAQTKVKFNERDELLKIFDAIDYE